MRNIVWKGMNSVYYFIGIKGSGMASLACILSDAGCEVAGSDIPKMIFTQKPLEERGIAIYDFDEKNIQAGMQVIIGNAFDQSNPEVKKALSDPSVKAYYYHEFLGEYIKRFKSVCIAGTHGKTTTTGMMAHLLDAVAPSAYLIGDGSGHMPKDAKYFALESCEYQRHFMAYHPDYAVILNIDLDHVDYYPTLNDYIRAFEDFASQAKQVICFGDDENIRKMQINQPIFYVGCKDGNDLQAVNIEQNETGMSFDVMVHGERFGHFHFPYVGMHLLWNSLSVIAVAYLEGCNAVFIQEVMAGFSGVKRRFNIEINQDQIYVDDYAHHPTAISATIQAARIRFPNQKITAIFKPDRYSRIAYFMDDFAKSLAEADRVVLCPFPENQKREDGIDITIDDLAKKIDGACVMSENEENAKALAEAGAGVYLFMSSKDIYKFKNLVKNFHK